MVCVFYFYGFLVFLFFIVIIVYIFCAVFFVYLTVFRCFVFNMTIQGLWNYVNSHGLAVERRLSDPEFAGFTVVIDGHAWLHAAAVSSAYRLLLGVEDYAYVETFMRRLRALRAAGNHLSPVVVFDGAVPAEKVACVGIHRSALRRSAEADFHAAHAAGDFKLARRAACAAVRITDQMVASVLAAANADGFFAFRAPFEADASLANLGSSPNTVVVAEDSDLIAHGVHILAAKLQFPSLLCSLVRPFEVRSAARIPSLPAFRMLCVVAGCDYLPSPPRVAFTVALALVHSRASHYVSEVCVASDVDALAVFPRFVEVFASIVPRPPGSDYVALATIAHSAFCIQCYRAFAPCCR